MAKHVLYGSVAVVALLVGGALVVPSFIDWSSYKKPAIDAAVAATGYDIAIDGSIGLSLLPTPSVKVDNITLRLPGQADGAYLAHLDRVSVSVSLLPLLTGKIAVDDVELVKPDVRVTFGADGKPDWLTSRLQDLMAGKSDASSSSSPTTGTTAAGGKASSPVNIAIEDVALRDGQIRVTDTRSKKVYEAQQINFALQMDSLQGPFGAKGQLVYQNVPLSLRADMGKMTQASSDIPVNVQLAAPDQKTSLGFGGVVSLVDGWDVQGQLDFDGRNWTQVAGALTGQALALPDLPMSLKGLVSANARNIVLDNMAFGYGDLALNGSIKTRMPDTQGQKPFVQARLDSKTTLQVQKLMMAFGQGSSTTKPTGTSSGKGSAGTAGQVASAGVPKITLPIDLDAEISAPGLQIAAVPFEQMTLKLDAKDDTIKGRVKADKIPGQGALDVTAYPGQDGALMLDARLNVANPVKLVTDGLGMAMPAGSPLDRMRDVALQADALLAPQRVEAKAGTLKWTGGDLSFGGSSYTQTSGKRPQLGLTLGSNQLNLDALLGVQSRTEKAAPGASSSGVGAAAPAGASSAPALKQTILNSTKNIALPMDIDFAVSFGEVITGGKTIKDLNSVGRLVGDQLVLDSLDVGSYQGVGVKARGTVGSIQSLTGLDLTLKADARDAAAAMTSFGMTPPNAGRDLGAASLDVGYKGTLDQANVSADVTLWGVTFAAAGPVADPLGTPQVENLKVAIKAPSVATAMKIVQPDFTPTAPLNGPLSVTADTTIRGKSYALKNLSGSAGTMSVSGNLTADLSGARPVVSGGLQLGDVPLDALMGVERKTTTSSSAAASTASSPSSGGSTARWSSEAINTDWMRAADVDLGITAKSITYNLWTLNQPTLDFSMKGGVLDVKDVQAGLFGGKISANGQMKATAKGQPLSISATADMTSVNARSLTNALMNRALNRFDGTLGLDFKVSSVGASPAALVSGLSGSAQSNGKAVTINGIDVARLVSWLTTDLKPSTTVDGLMGSFYGNGATTFDTHEGTYAISGGTVTLEKMLFDGTQASINTTGNVNLPAWTIDTTSALQVKNQANVPALNFSFKGSLSNPASSFGKGLFQNYLQSKIQAQVGKVIEKKLGGKLQDLGLGGLLGGGQNNSATPTTGTDSSTSGSATDQTGGTPSSTTDTGTATPTKPEDVLIDVIKGLGR